MKKLFFVSLVAFVVPFCSKAQFSKKTTLPAPVKDTLKSTLDLKLTLVSDTSRAKIVLFAKGDTDHFLSWTDGYIVVKSYKLPNGNVAGTIGNLAYTTNWELIKPDDIYDVKLVKAEQSAR
jgi:hypothetical protein